MVKARKKSGRFEQKQEYDSDDERAYEDLGKPDPKSREYIYDDIDEFHAGEEKIMLETGAKIPTADSSDEQEEILPMDLSDDDEPGEGNEPVEVESDSEDQNDEDVVDTIAWGKKKSTLYGTDYIADDFGGFAGSDAEEAQAEEEEARALEKRLREQLDEEDFALDTFEMEKKPLEEGIKVEINVDQLSKREKISLLKKKYPEMLVLIEEFKSKMSEIKDSLQPLMSLIEDGTILEGKASQYIKLKHKIYLNYCINISFYMVLRARASSTDNHPVIKRLATYKTLINQLEPLDKQLQEDLDKVLESCRSGKKITLMEKNESVDGKKNKAKKVISKVKSKKVKKETEEITNEKKKKSVQFETEDEKLALQQYNMLKSGRRIKHQPREEMEEEEDERDSTIAEDVPYNVVAEGEKRGINYQIAKNKGLTPRRKKEYRNPRVKHRIKYRKAKIRRKGQVRDPRNELQRYGGELFGIRSSVKKSIKIK